MQISTLRSFINSISGRPKIVALIFSIPFAHGVTFDTLAQLHPSALKGQFHEVVEAECIGSKTVRRGIALSPSGFDEILRPKGKSFKFSAASQGTRTFGISGTGIATRKTVATRTASKGPMIKLNLGSPTVELKHAFTYEIMADGTIRSEIVPGSFIARVANSSPRLAGLSFTIDRRVLLGRFSKDGRVLTLRSEKPSVETVTYSNGDVVERVCDWVHRIFVDP